MDQTAISPEQRAAIEQAQQINNLISMRATLGAAMAQSVVEAMETWVQIAQTPGHPIQVPARHWLGRLVNVLEQAKAATSGIHLADRVPEVGNGRT